MDERTSKRINWTRTDMVLEAKASVVATACPFCVVMFEDGIRGRNAEETLQARDLAELVAEALGEDETPSG